MVKASPYIIQNISMVLEKEELREAKELCEKFSARYSEDTELVEICETYSRYTETQKLAGLKETKMSLQRLRSTRVSNGGGGGLWYRDRRPHFMQVLKIA